MYIIHLITWGLLVQDQEEIFLCFWVVPMASPSACSSPLTLLYAVREHGGGNVRGWTRKLAWLKQMKLWVSVGDVSDFAPWHKKSHGLHGGRSFCLCLPSSCTWFEDGAGITSSVLPRPQIRAKTTTKKNNPQLGLHKRQAVFQGPCWKGHRCHLQTRSQLEGGCFGQGWPACQVHCQHIILTLMKQGKRLPLVTVQRWQWLGIREGGKTCHPAQECGCNPSGERSLRKEQGLWALLCLKDV